MAVFEHIEVRPASTAVGAVVTGVELRSVGDAAFDELRRALGEYGVLFFRDQHLTPDDHLAFAERWGPINVNRFFAAVPTHPAIAEVRKEPDQQMNIGGGWHTDHSYDQEPALGSVLVARDLPELGGDTLFAGMYAAYDALSDGLKATLLGLRAVHSSRHVFGATGAYRAAGADMFTNEDQATQDAVHPVVIRHPISGRAALYVNRAFTTHIDGWSVEESQPLLEYLYRHASRDEFTYRFRWEPGSVAMWDNRAVHHNALNDYHGHRRLMHRVTIDGSRVDAFADAAVA